MLLVILISVGGTLLAVFLLGLFVWWLTGLCTRYDASEPGWTDWSPESYRQLERNMVDGDSLKLWRNPKTGRLVIPANEIVWSEDGT